MSETASLAPEMDLNHLVLEDENDNDDTSQPPPPSLDSGHLSWRMPPEESLSDWTIEIGTTTDDDDDESAAAAAETQGRGKKSVYHVHKCVLAVGPKKCQYFERLFQHSFSEGETQTSTIELHSSAAAAVPWLLDYLYSPKHELAITTENATALYFLGQYLENASLRWHAAEFRQKDLSVTNSGIYYAQAKLFQEEKVVERIIQCCYENLEGLSTDSELMKVSDVDFWSKLLDLTRSDQGSSRWFYNSKHLSCLIGKFIALHLNCFNATTFTRFTDPDCIVEIDQLAAVALLHLEAVFFPARQTSVALSSLQTRCVEALARNWEYMDVLTLELGLCGLNPLLFRCTFAESLDSARRRLWLADTKAALGNPKLTSRILVSGAGSEEANGIYTVLCTWYNGSLVYSKRMADESGGDVEIYVDTQDDDPPESLSWWICRVATENTSGHWLYKRPMEENQRSPPCRGWDTAIDGLLPAPTLTFLEDDLIDRDT